MSQRWGRFTVGGGEQVEQRITEMVEEVADVFCSLLRPQDYRALVMIGGYGRGEGGVEKINGAEQPHNNLDFVLIANRLEPRTKERLHFALEALRQKFGLGIDLSFTSALSLRTAPPLIIWYDMRFGHKTILGDAGFVPSLKRFELDRIPPQDMRDLMVNRGTLLLINDLLLEQDVSSLARCKAIVRHVMKCVIGYGDALLFVHGAYHWSYQERQRRMCQHDRVPPKFRQLYDEAMEFRFQPNYAKYLGRNLEHWIIELRERLAPIHIEFERWRLRCSDLSWSAYLPAALAHVLSERPLSPRSWLRKSLNFVRNSEYPEPADWRVKAGFRCGGWRTLLSLLFPVIAYRLDNADYRRLAEKILGAPSGESAALRAAYLAKWAMYGDVNFPTLLRKLGIALLPERTSAKQIAASALE